MSADVDAICGAEYGAVTDERVNRRNGYRRRELDTRAGTVELSIPRLRQGSYFPSWLLEPRRRAEQSLVQVIADCYLAGVSTRRVDKLVKQLDLEGISKSLPRRPRAAPKTANATRRLRTTRSLTRCPSDAEPDVAVPDAPAG